METKKIVLCVLLVFSLGAWMVAPRDVLADDKAAFDLKVYSDYHLNQDGRPTASYDFIVPLYDDDQSLLFFNPRYHVDDETNMTRAEEWNLGIGYRRMVFGDRAIVGANVFYDWRRSVTGNEFEQMGAGLELMTDNVTARVNGYLSLSAAAELERHRWREFYFAPRSLNYRDYESVSYEVPTSGFDGEIGFLVPYISDYVETWVYGGGYYFEPVSSPADAETMEGVKGRIEVKPTDYLSFNCEIRDDNVRGTAYYGEVAVEVPFSIENLVKGRNPFEGLKEKVTEKEYMALADRMYDTVERDPDIITGYAAGSPDDQVIKEGVWTDLTYVAAGTPGSGGGTWASPYVGLDYAIGLAGAGDVLFVKSGTYSESPTISTANLTIWGQGYKPAGVTAMPHGAGVAYPTVTGPFTINAADAEVMGLKFTYSTGPAMAISAAGDYARVHHNEFRPGANTGIYVFSSAGGVIIDNNKFYITAGGTVGTTNSFGVRIIGSTSPARGARITNNTFSVTRTGTNAWGATEEPGIAAIYADVTATYGDERNPLTIIGNTITVKDTTTSTSNDAPSVRGIDLNAAGSGYDLYALIANNKLTISSTNPRTPTAYRVEGIHAYAEDELHVSITGNDLSGGISGKDEVTGICLGVWHDGEGYSRLIGGLSAGGPAEVSYNKLKVANTDTTNNGYNNAYGIYAEMGQAGGSVFLLSAVKNDLSLGVSARGEAYGIFLTGLNAASEWAIIDNTLKVSSATSLAQGIFGYGYTYGAGASSIVADILGNNLSGGVSSAGTDTTDHAYGINLYCEGGGGGGNITSWIGNNLLKVSAAGGDAYGILEDAGLNLTTTVFGNNLSTGGVTGKTHATGIMLTTGNALSADVLSNSLKVTGTTGVAKGVHVLGETILGRFNYNDLSKGITGSSQAEGFQLVPGDFAGSSSGTTADPVEVSDNKIKATAGGADGDAYGIHFTGYGTYFADITGNDLSYGISGKHLAAGISLNAWNGVGGYNGVSYLAEPVLIADNRLKVTSPYTSNDPLYGRAYGIYADTVDGDILADVHGNNMSYGVSGKYLTAGILLSAASGNLGFWYKSGWHDELPIRVDDNILKATSSAGDACGVSLYAGGDYASGEGSISADVLANDLSAGVTGYSEAYGILAGVVPSGTGSDYSDYATLDVSDNVMKVTSTYAGTDNNTDGVAAGILARTDNYEITGTYNRNRLSAGVSGKWEAYGIYLKSFSSSALDPASVDENVLKVTSASGDATGIGLTNTGSGGVDTAIRKNNLSAGVSGLNLAYGIRVFLSISDIVGLDVDRNSMLVTSTGGGAYGVNLTANSGSIYGTTITNNNLLSGITGKYDAAGIYLHAGDHIISDDGPPPVATLIEGNQMKVTSTNTAFVSGASPTPAYLVSGIHLDTDAGGIYADILTNTLTVTGAGSTQYNVTDGVWGISLVSNNGPVGWNDGGTRYSGTINGNNITVTNSNNTLYTAGADGVHLDSPGNAMWESGNIYCDIYNNYLTVKAYREAAGAWISAENHIGWNTPTTLTSTFALNEGTVNGTLTGTNARRWLLYLVGDANSMVDWGRNYVTPTTGTWTGTHPTSSIGPVEDTNYFGSISP